MEPTGSSLGAECKSSEHKNNDSDVRVRMTGGEDCENLGATD